jgi:LPS-assembly lipoprotein
LIGLSGCLYRPLYGTGSYAPDASAYALQQIYVPEVDTRVAQQVRNRLIFLFEGGKGSGEPIYELRLRVTSVNSVFAASREARDNTAGAITVNAAYELVDARTRAPIAKGSRSATASYDRTAQNFANDRALRDAEDRAAHEAAEAIRLAVAGILTRPSGS